MSEQPASISPRKSVPAEGPCQRCTEPVDAPHEVTINVRGLGVWSGSFCSSCARNIAHEAMTIFRKPQVAPVPEAILRAERDEKEDPATAIGTCTECGRDVIGLTCKHFGKAAFPQRPKRSES